MVVLLIETVFIIPRWEQLQSSKIYFNFNYLEPVPAVFSILSGSFEMPSTRKVLAVVNFTGQDYENFGSNEYPPPLNTSRTVFLSDNLPQNLVQFVSKWGGECRAEFNMLAQRLDNGEVKIIGDFLLYEGTSEDTNDLDGRRQFEFVVPRSSTVPFTSHVRNDDEDDDDWGHIEMLVTNDRVPDADND